LGGVPFSSTSLGKKATFVPRRIFGTVPSASKGKDSKEMHMEITNQSNEELDR